MAPSSRARSIFSALDDVTVTCAPTAAARPTAMVATPPPAPRTSKRLAGPEPGPGEQRPVGGEPDQRQRGGLSPREPGGPGRDAGSRGTRTSSAYVPGRWSPRISQSGPGATRSSPHQSDGTTRRPRRSRRRCPRRPRPGRAGSGGAYLPCRTRTSCQFSAAARSRTTASPGPPRGPVARPARALRAAVLSMTIARSGPPQPTGANSAGAGDAPRRSARCRRGRRRRP